MKREKIRAFLDERKDEPMLEIGPLIDPFLTKDRYNVYYSDVNSKNEIYEVYKTDKNLGSEDEIYNKIMPIDFVIRETYLKAVGDMRFSVVFSSHVIEHVPDVIGHLLELSDILVDGGHVVMMIPDKRYCFDHFRDVTPFRDIYDAFINKDIRSTARLVFDHVFWSNPCNTPGMYWNNEIPYTTIIDDSSEKYEFALRIYNDFISSGVIIPGWHIWSFTDKSFLELLRDCARAKLLPYALAGFSPTPVGEFEFSIILEKRESIIDDDQERKNEILKLTQITETESWVENKLLWRE